jgi:hypothetical protein
MALVKKGDSLAGKLLNPGGTYTTDGYGLITGTATFSVDKAASGSAVVGGQVHPSYSDLFVHKYTLTKGPLEVDTIVAEYVGIDSTTTTGGLTNPNVTASNGLTSEHIVTHPNFFGPATGFTTAIAGNGTTFTTSTINSDEKVGGVFGAHFKGTATNAGGFAGFKDSSTAEKQYFYGKNQYLAPTTSFSGTIYTTTSGNCATLRDRVGKTSTTNSFGGIKLLPDHIGTSFTANVKGAARPTIMLSQVNFEDYCVQSSGTPKIFKINYEIRFNREGYPAEVYAGA